MKKRLKVDQQNAKKIDKLPQAKPKPKPKKTAEEKKREEQAVKANQKKAALAAALLKKFKKKAAKDSEDVKVNRDCSDDPAWAAKICPHISAYCMHSVIARTKCPKTCGVCPG